MMVVNSLSRAMGRAATLRRLSANVLAKWQYYRLVWILRKERFPVAFFFLGGDSVVHCFL